MQSLARFTSPLLKGTRPLHAGQLLCLQAQLRISLINTGSYSTGAAEALPEVDGAELIKLLDAKTPGLLLLDVRSPEELPSGTINGSINVPTPVFKDTDTTKLDDAIHQHIKHAKQVVTYCLYCIPGKRGETAARALQGRLKALGVSPPPHIRLLRGGVDGFMRQHAPGRPDLVTLPPGGWTVDKQ